MKKTELNKFLINLNKEGIRLTLDGDNIKYTAPIGRLQKKHIEIMKMYKPELLQILSAKSDKKEPFALTDVQAAYLLGRENIYEYGNIACHIYMEVMYPLLDYDRVKEIWNRLIQTHDMLRVVFTPDKKQKILEMKELLPIAFQAFNNCDSIEEIESQLEKIRGEMGEQVFQAECWPLYEIRLTNLKNTSVLHISMDFLVADWTSIIFLLSEFEKAYFEEKIPLVESPNSFQTYIMKELGKKESKKYIEDKKYWEGRFASLPQAPSLPMVKESAYSEKKSHFQRHSIRLRQAEWIQIKNNAKKYRLTPSVVILTCYALVIAKWSEHKRFCLNLTLLNREEEYRDDQFVVGDFTKTSLLEIDASQSIPFWEQAKKIQTQLLNDMEHEAFSGVEAIREIAKIHGYKNAFMPIVFTSAIGSQDNNHIRPMLGEFGYGISQTPQVFVDCQVMDTNQGLMLNWDVRNQTIRPDVVEDMFHTMEEIIHSIAESELFWNQEENVDIPAWQKALYRKVNQTEKEISPKLLYEDAWKAYKQTPEKIVLADWERTFSYHDFMSRSIALSKKLLASGMHKGDRVAVSLPKCLEQVMAAYGILMAGGVYVPLDIDFPDERIEQIKRKAGILLVITKSVMDELEVAEDREFLPVSVSVDDLAYIIFTSGSTGEPKGVTISHKAAWNTIKDINDRIGLCSDDAILGVSRMCFDLSVYDLFGSLSCGALLVYPTQENMVNPLHWLELIKKYKISVWNSVPAIMELLVHSTANMDFKRNSLKTILLSGDWIPVDLADHIKELNSNVTVYSLGGATEASIWSNIYNIQKKDSEYNSVPYGKPLANQEFKILDSKQKQVPVWVKGDLYIKGTGLSKGYIADEEINSRSFFADSQDGRVMYKTGDKGLYHPDGNIEFCGREDSQVKIHGYRIELKEIEAAIKSVDGIQNAYVGVREGESKDIVALATTKEMKTKKEESISSYKHPHTLEQIDRDLMQKVFSMLHQVPVQFMKEIYESRKEFKSEYQWIMDRWEDYLTGMKEQEPNNTSMLSVHLEELQLALQTIPHTESLTAYLSSSMNHLMDVCTGRIAPYDLLYPDKTIGFVRKFYRDNILFNDLNEVAAELVENYCNEKNPDMLHILELGAGTGATTDRMVDVLSGRKYQYYFTDNIKYLLNDARQRYHELDMHVMNYDINEDFRKAGFVSNCMDIVIASGVLENAKDMKESMDSIMKMLKPDGLLVWIDPVKDVSWILVSQIFMMEQPADYIRKEKLFLDADDWKTILKPYAVSSFCQYPSEDIVKETGIALFSARVKTNKTYIASEDIRHKIEKVLPSYMLPRWIEVVDEFPLTSNGKIDTKEIARYPYKERMEESKKFVEKGTKNTYIEEITKETESEEQTAAFGIVKQITDLWTDLLGAAQLEREDNLYNLGADSLIMAQGVSKTCKLIKDKNSCEIAFDELLREVLNIPTLSNLLNFVMHKFKNNQKECGKEWKLCESYCFDMLKENPKSKKIIILFHSGIGCINEYHQFHEFLCEHSFDNIGIFKISDVDIYKKVENSRYLMTLAEEYSQKIKTLPYEEIVLVGHSFGGMLAYETAGVLQSYGKNVAKLCLIEAYPIQVKIQESLIMEAMYQNAIGVNLMDYGIEPLSYSQIAYLIACFSDNQVIKEEDLYKKTDDTIVNKTLEILKDMRKIDKKSRFATYGKQLLGGFDAAFLEEMFFEFCYSSAALEYMPSNYIGDIVYYQARKKDFPDFCNKGIAALKDAIIGELCCVTMDADHFTIIKEHKNILKMMESLR